jgi:ribosomal-protein-alanine N-acetyltransferase
VTPFAGFVGPWEVNFDDPPRRVEIGWRLARAYWGKGYATEAAKAALDFAFGPGGLEEIVAFVAPGNRASRAVMERIGLREDPAGAFDHPRVPEGHPLRRHLLYRARRP